MARRPLRTFRPQDATDVYAHPRPELARLVTRGVLHRAAPGYYIVVPPEQAGRRRIPNLEATAAGIAAAINGPDHAIVMGISAARLHRCDPPGVGPTAADGRSTEHTIAAPPHHQADQVTHIAAISFPGTGGAREASPT